MKICWIGIIGKPNVGKSTLINSVINYDLSIISNKAQTTRDQIIGIYNDEEYQLIFFDTPGIHKSQSKLGEELNKKAFNTINESDVLLFLTPSNEKLSNIELSILDKIASFNNKIALITKIDLVNNEQINNKIIELSRFNFKKILLMKKNDQKLINNLLSEIKFYSYESVMMYDSEYITDKSELFISKEIIRYCASEYLKQELPHSIAIEIVKYDINSNNSQRNIEAIIYCKKESQKGIIIGKNGSMIKKIGTKARRLISEKFNTNVNLRINVKLDDNWINDNKKLKKFGYKN